jgi:IS30 family transposase
MAEAIKKLPNNVKTLTLENGTEFHGYADVEKTAHVSIYFATPYHSWERLIRHEPQPSAESRAAEAAERELHRR